MKASVDPQYPQKNHCVKHITHSRAGRVQKGRFPRDDWSIAGFSVGDTVSKRKVESDRKKHPAAATELCIHAQAYT